VIVMPRFTPGVKVERTRGFGAEVVLHGDTLERRAPTPTMLADTQGLTFVHPYDDEAMAAGQGTLGLEMLQAVPDLDTLVIAVGGGGLISGMATAAKALKPGIEVIGVQTVRAFRPWSTRSRARTTRRAPAPLPRALPWARPASITQAIIIAWWTTWCWWTRATSSRPC
jgi:threonine dehydratase